MTASKFSSVMALCLVVSIAEAEDAPKPTGFVRAAGDPESLIIQPGKQFTADSYVYKPLAADAPLEENSDKYVEEFMRQMKKYYNTVNVNTHEYTPAVYQVGPNQPTVCVKAVDKNKPDWKFPPLQELWKEVPVPDDLKPAKGTDMEAIIYQPSTGKCWEFWQLQKTGAKTKDSSGREVEEWGARWGGYIDDLSKNPGYYVPPKEGYKFGTQASGLPFLAGLLTIDEQLRGEVNHALHILLVETMSWDYYSFPAQRSDGHITPQQNQYAIPEGAIFRLPADLDLDKMEMDPYARMIAKAVQKYGMVVSDKAGGICFRAENPAGRYAVDPYSWIFRGRNEKEKSYPPYERLKSFPWRKLQMLKLQMNKPIPAAKEAEAKKDGK